MRPFTRKIFCPDGRYLTFSLKDGAIRCKGKIVSSLSVKEEETFLRIWQQVQHVRRAAILDIDVPFPRLGRWEKRARLTFLEKEGK